MSYSQNREDVVLARAFAGVDKGLYVDVGANDPTVDSVTRYFYELGWRGVNIEPQTTLFAELKAARPNDVNLNIGIGQHSGEMVFHHVPDINGWSTFDAATAARIAASGHVVTETVVPVERLDTVLSAHTTGRVVDFLKVDVEGFEQQVLGDVDWTVVRPRVLVVESTVGESVWETRLVASGYRRTLWDGVNVFLVREEDDATLGQLLSWPACVLDQFEPFAYVRYIRDQEVLLAQQARSMATLAAAHVDALMQVRWGVAHTAAAAALGEVYVLRPDLRQAFGDAPTVDIVGLVAWAAVAATADESADSDALRLAPFADHYAWLTRLP